jgi:signal transduction histidine kinase/ActR/RegA family two-component response regulator
VGGFLPHLNEPRRKARALAIAAAGFAVALLLMQTRLFQQLELQLGDLQARALAKPVDLSDVVLVDVTDKSMRELEDSIGAWPFSRESYALVTKYLRAASARSITFDILFSDSRGRDQDLADVLSTTPNVVHLDHLRRVAWNGVGDVPAYEWGEFLPPREMFVWRDKPLTALGIIGVRPDTDGWLRRVPLLHRAKGDILPGLSLAALFPNTGTPPVSYSKATGHLSIGPYTWPVDEQGAVLLRLPANLRPSLRKSALSGIHFSEVYSAAVDYKGTGQLDRWNIPEKIKGKRVFVGSSAFVLGDYQNALYERVPGLVMLAVVSELLRQGEVLAPPRFMWNALLVAFALGIPLYTFRERENASPLLYAVGFLVTPLMVVAISAALYLNKQAVSLGLPFLTGVLVFLFFAGHRLWRLHHERLRLFYEKHAAEETYKLKSQFISHMTHELRTPLAAIMGFNRLLSEPDLIDKSRSQYGKVIDKNSHHLMTLINNMLDQSKIEAGQMRINKAPARIREAVDDVVMTLSPLATEKQLDLKATYRDPLPNVLELDAFRLRQVLLNLIGNAIKFTRRGSITVSVEWSDEALRVVVLDTGSGMTSEAAQRIFIPFKQGADNTQHQYGGTGLGLAISRNLCELMGGSLDVESKLGEGSAFFVRIPAARCEENAVPATTPELPAAPLRLEGSILLAEDNNDIRELVTRLLSKMGLTVTAVADGEQAVQSALQLAPGVVLMDMEMPVLDGMSATKRLRALGFNRPILAMTAHPEGPEVERALNEGFDGYLEKPVNRDRLFRTLAIMLERERTASTTAAERAA